MSELKEQAVRWAKRFETPVVSVFSFDLDEKLNIVTFNEMTEDWLQFIIDCRTGIEHDYYIINGPMAND